jgi:hypothetical protein
MKAYFWAKEALQAAATKSGLKFLDNIATGQGLPGAANALNTKLSALQSSFKNPQQSTSQQNQTFNNGELDPSVGTDNDHTDSLKETGSQRIPGEQKAGCSGCGDCSSCKNNTSTLGVSVSPRLAQLLQTSAVKKEAADKLKQNQDNWADIAQQVTGVDPKKLKSQDTSFKNREGGVSAVNSKKTPEQLAEEQNERYKGMW